MEQTNRRTWTVPGAIALLSLVTQAPEAHHSVTMFDTMTPVTVRGRLVGAELINPHSFLYVEQETDDGTTVWAVEGPAGSRLKRIRMDQDTFPAGAEIEACGYVLKSDAESANRQRQVLVAEVLVMPDGKARLWSPYGNSLCREQNGYEVSD